MPASYTGQVRTASAACDRHSSDAAKFLALELACRLIGATQREIGDHYGGITSAAVSTMRRKIRDRKYPIAEFVDQMVRKLTRGKLNKA